MGIYSRTRCKSTTPFVLALWLFALAASIAHACGVGESLHQATVVKPASVATDQDSRDGALPACDKFCAEDTPLLMKLKVVEDSPTGIVLLAAVPTFGALIVNSERTSQPLPGPDPPPAIAVNTRFVRLAL